MWHDRILGQSATPLREPSPCIRFRGMRGPELTLSGWMDAFARHLETERHASAHTTSAYLSDLAQFAQFLTTAGRAEDIRSIDVRSLRGFLARLHGSRE